MSSLKSFRFELSENNPPLKGRIQPIEGSVKNGVPQQFEVLLDGDREPFTIECTDEGWKTDDLIVQQSIVEAVGSYLLLQYE